MHVVGAKEGGGVSREKTRVVAAGRSSVSTDGGEGRPGCGGEISITPPPNHNLRRGGEDTAVVSLYVSWGDAFDTLCEQLRLAQTAAQADEPELNGSIVRVGEFDLVLRPAGAKSGGAGGPYYAFVCEVEGFVIRIARRQTPGENMPNVSATLGSVVLMRHGLTAAWQHLGEVIEAMGGNILDNKLSRIDPCADLAGMNVEALVKTMMDKKVVTRARKRAIYFDADRPTGLSFGSGDLLCRAYDKLLEVREKRDEEKYGLLVEKRWGGEPDHATRVEFQLRRECIKTFGISTVEDWIEKRAGVCAYLVNDWLRFCKTKDRDNQQRSEISDEWRDVREAFEDWAGSDDPSERFKELHADADALVKQASGCMVSVVAINGNELPESLDEAYALVCERLYHAMYDDAAGTMSRLAKRRKHYEAIARAQATGKPQTIDQTRQRSGGLGRPRVQPPGGIGND